MNDRVRVTIEVDVDCEEESQPIIAATHIALAAFDEAGLFPSSVTAEVLPRDERNPR